MLDIPASDWYGSDRMTQERQALQEVLCRNLRRLREARDWSQDRLAAEALAAGLRWTRSTVADLEARRRDLSVEELVLLPAIFGEPVEIYDLLKSEGSFRVGVFDMDAGDVGRLLRGYDSTPPDDFPLTFGRPIAVALPEEAISPLLRAGDLARRQPERKVAKALNEDPVEVTLTALSLWGHGVLEERERRLGEAQSEGDLARLRGHITRALIKEIDEARAEMKGDPR